MSDHTLIFVRTLEEMAFRQLGQQCAREIQTLVISLAPGVRVDGVYWDGAEYYVLMRDKADYQRVKRNVKQAVTKAIPRLLADADTDRHCQDYETTIQFGYGGVVPMQFLRG